MASEDSAVTRAAESTTFADAGIGQSGLYGLSPEFAGDYWSGFGYNAYGQTFPPYFIDNQKRGEALPYYISAQQLKILRDRSRRVCGENEFAICAVENRISFLVGSGLSYRTLPTRDGVPTDLTAAAQKVVDTFVTANRLGDRERESVMRGDRDGEFFHRLFYRPNGLLVVRFIEPEHIRSVEGDSDPSRSFGIETDPQDIESVRGYWVVHDPVGDPIPKFVPAKNVAHAKFNVDSAAKRGLPLFYPVEANLRRAEELLAAMSVTAKTRAKIALIRRIEGSSKSASERLKAETETGQAFDPSTGGPTNIEQFKLGTILTASKNINYEYPEIGSAESGIEVLKAELRAIAARLVFPEMMLSADASNGTYSSQLVAEAPATRNFQRCQQFYRGYFGESKAPGHEALVWRQIKYAVECGFLPPNVLTDVKVIAQAPEIIPRDPDKAAAANKTYFDMGVKSPQRICEELGGNWKQTVQEREEAGLPSLEEQQAQTVGVADGAVNEAEAPPGADEPPPDETQDQGGEGMDDNEYEFSGADFI